MLTTLAVALLLALQIRAVETLPVPPTLTVAVDGRDMTLSVQPQEAGVSVRWTVLDLPDSRSWAKPTKSEPLPKNGTRVTFRHPRAAYAFVIQLSDGAQWRATVTPDGRIDLRQTRQADPVDPI